ncbi:uncharacterized protein LOC114273571 [Camellia sinensis]|uniref:uncharacterized protein LOC114273571 n=1 Tax=Camellia sinensis TaxID=4442 RepID=UPI001035719E|nr:uncharacterized protein LOC114273571 [Camellia sinensis]
MTLKKEWQAWTKLMDSSKGVSGIGFDYDTELFQAPDEWWDKMESINKACAKFRKKTLEHRDLMETVFMGASATGKHHWTPGENLPEPAEDSSDSAKRRKTPSTSVSKSKKGTSGASVIAESMNRMTDVVRSKNQQVTVRHLTGNESLYTISECMHKLSSIPFLIATPLFHFASTLMDNADYREVMMCQLDDDRIIGWLTQKQLQCTASAPFANLFGGRRM